MELLNGLKKEEANDWEVEVTSCKNNDKDRFSIHIEPNKIGIEVVGKFEKPEDLDSVFALVRKCVEEALAAQGRLVNI
jgi:hypothetical protein